MFFDILYIILRNFQIFSGNIELVFEVSCLGIFKNVSYAFHPFEVTLLRVTPTPLMIDPSFSHVLRKPCNLSTAHLQKETCPSLASLLDVEVPQTYDSTETE